MYDKLSKLLKYVKNYDFYYKKTVKISRTPKSNDPARFIEQKHAHAKLAERTTKLGEESASRDFLFSFFFLMMFILFYPRP